MAKPCGTISAIGPEITVDLEQQKIQHSQPNVPDPVMILRLLL